MYPPNIFQNVHGSNKNCYPNYKFDQQFGQQKSLHRFRWLCPRFSAERSFSIGAIEVATALLLEDLGGSPIFFIIISFHFTVPMVSVNISQPSQHVPTQQDVAISQSKIHTELKEGPGSGWPWPENP